jgi:uroporphyrin-III C-methyltransferase
VVVFDHLVGEGILELIPREAIRIDVGKAGHKQHRNQEDINEILADKARSGQTVVRLKGGDPFLFGRGAEEVDFLASRGIPCEVVPGVSSAIAVPEAAGIPVTHRDHSSAVTIVTGHDSPSKKGGMVDWSALARTSSTLVILMGMERLDEIVDLLVRGGRPGETPVAIIERGTHPDQKVTVGTLNDIVRRAVKAKAPAVIVIGEVVRLRKRTRRGK